MPQIGHSLRLSWEGFATQTGDVGLTPDLSGYASRKSFSTPERRSFSRGSDSGETFSFAADHDGSKDRIGHDASCPWNALRAVLGFRRDGGGFGEFKGQPRPGGENGIVFLLSTDVFLALVLRLVFVGRAAR